MDRGVRSSRLSIYLVSSDDTPAGFVHKSRGDNVMHMCVQLKRCCVCVCVLQRGIVVADVTTLCSYDLRKDGLFVLSWASVRRVRRRCISSGLLMCGGGVHSILLLPLVARCLEKIDVCIWCMFVFMCAVVTVKGLLECLLCSGRCRRSDHAPRW